MRAYRLAVLLAMCAPSSRQAAAQVKDSVPARAPAPAPDSISETAPLPDSTVQLESDEERGARWRTSYFPYLTGGANDSPLLGARLRHWQPADYEARTTYTAAFNADAGIAPKGSRFVAASFKVPGLWDEWRVNVQGIGDRLVRYGYFGLGNDTEYDKDAVTDAQPFLYRMRRTHYRGAVEVTRHLKGKLYVALLTEFDHARFTALPGPSIFRADVPSGDISQEDFAGRLAFIYDTRDNEFDTHQGLLLEAGTQAGTGGDGYTRQYAILRGYLQVREGTVLAARIAGSGMGGTPTFNARFTLPGWEKSVPVLGGEYSHRSLDFGRLTGRGTLFANFEAHHDILSLGDLGALTLIAFLDAGRVFERESFKLTTKDMKVGGGGGVALRILRSTIFTLNLAGGPDGFNSSVGTGWMF